MNDAAQVSKQQAVLKHQGFFVLRTPLLSAQEFVDWTSTGAAAASTDSTASLSAQHQALQQWLRTRAQCPVFREAIYLASPSLHRSLAAWDRKPNSEQGQKTELALVRYFTRMTHRATPFGLFAGCSLGSIAQQTKLQLVSRAEYVRKTRLDHAVVCRVLDRILQDPILCEQLRYRRNDTLVLAAGRWRHAAIKESEDGHVSFHLVATDRSPYLDAVIERAQQFQPFAVLQDAISAAASSASKEDAAAFLHMLIQSQILSCELSVPVTGSDPLQALCTQLDLLDSLDSQASAPSLHPLRNAIARIDQHGLGVPISHYDELAQQLTPITNTSGTKHLVQVDLCKPVIHAALSAAWVHDIRQAVMVLAKLDRRRSHSSLLQFKESFRRRYEGQRVPLLLALDPECGVGFDEQKGIGEEATALLADLTLRAPVREADTTWSAMDRRLLALVMMARETGSNVVQLPMEWIDSLRSASIPDALAVLGSFWMAQKTDTPVRADDSLLFRLESAIGPSAASLLGRFCHTDPALLQAVESLAAREQALRPHELLVEITHRLPGRTGNIALRPVLRKHELELLGRSGAEPGTQIRLDELSLFLRDDELWLYCERLGRRIRPRLSNAHNHSHPGNLHIYRFLCALHEEEGAAGFHFHWGPLTSLPFLPRVSLKQIVFSPARWRLDPKQIAALGNPVDARQHARIFLGIQTIRSQYRLPRQIQLVEGDHTLHLDLDNVMSVLAFVDYARNRSQLLIEEVLGACESSIVHGPEGHYTNEVIIPLLRGDDSSHSEAPSQEARIPTLRTHRQTSFPVGTEWLYCKLYTGMATADRILRKQLGPLVAKLSSHGVDRWFFIRYADPDWHLRLRLHGDPLRLQTEVLPLISALSQELLRDGQISRMQLDTYEPEWERYGGEEGMLLSEQLFCADSEAALSLLPLCMGEHRASQRWQVALASMLALLADFLPSETDRLSVVASAYASFRREFAEDPEVSWRLGARFRKERSGLEQLLEDLTRNRTDKPLFAALRARSCVVSPIAARLHALSRQGFLRVSIPSLLHSHLHMSANRILRSAARAQELVLYDWISRLYRSSLAQQRSVDSGSNPA